MAAISGKDGKVRQGSTDIVDTLAWTLNKISNNPAYGSNATAGGTARVAGRKDWNGTATWAYQSGAEEITEGTSYSLQLNLNATKTFAGTALFSNISYNVDVNTGAIVTVTGTFEANGAITGPSA